MARRSNLKQRNTKKIRTTTLAVLLCVALLFYIARIYQIQVVDAASYAEQVAGISTRKAVLKAARGEILDCYGRQIAINREGYNVVFNSAYLDRSQCNETIRTLISMLKQRNLPWVDNLPLDTKAPYGFTGTEAQQATLRSKLGLAHYATAENCFAQMVKRYTLEGMDTATQREIMGVRYSMDLADFSISNPFTFAQDISTEAMQRISEAGFLLKGVTVDVVPFREYAETDLAPHIIGSVGLITADDWDKYKDKGYSYNDFIGRSGIEEAAEEYLHGTDGEITYKIDNQGNILSTEVTREPVPGKTVMLTIDKTLQRTAQNSLKTSIESHNASGGKATGGAAVAVRVKDGGVLLAATYPTYDAKDYYTKYQQLAAQANSPLTNRPFTAVYPIGSTMKPAVAVAALETGKLSGPTETYYCRHVYDYYDDYKPKCMGYHRNVNVIQALSKSCNVFFYEMGRRLGIDTLNKYLKSFGFGSKTGVEVNESAGILAEPSENGNWVAGDTLRAAIGQMNAFTPIQIANYTATIANGGTRYKTTLISRVMSYDLTETVKANTATVAQKMEIKSTTIGIVKQGMLSVTEDGTGRTVFHDYPIKVGGKTGTAEAGGDTPDHSVFTAFAPYDNPEIAVSVVLEHGQSGSVSMGILRAILDQYFFAQNETYTGTAPYVVLQ